MASTMSLLPCHAERVYQSRAVAPSYLKKTATFNTTKAFPHLFFFVIAKSANTSRKRVRRLGWSVKSMVGDTSSSPSDNGKEKGTRLVRAIQSVTSNLTARINELKRGLSVKVLFFLVGFYCATAFATVIGQTGDWDILSAGLALVVVEVIGAIMYRASSRFFDRFRSLITMFNYWKAGLSLGLFLDSFKYEVDMLIEKCNAFNVGVDVLSLVWSCFLS